MLNTGPHSELTGFCLFYVSIYKQATNTKEPEIPGYTPAIMISQHLRAGDEFFEAFGKGD